MSLPARSVQIYKRFYPFEIRATKGPRGASHYPGGLFRHAFAEGGGAVIGRPDGSIVLKPRKGRRLWGMFPVAKPARPVGNKEPFLDNPVLAVLNPRRPKDGPLALRAARGRQDGRVIPGRGNNNAEGGRMFKLLPNGREIKSDLKDGAAVTLGLVGVPMLQAMLPLPAMLNTGYIRYATRAVLGYAGGRLVGRFLGREVGRMVTVGAVAGIVAEASQQVLAGSGILSAPHPAAMPAPAPAPAPAPGTSGLGAGYDRPVPIYLPEQFGGPNLNSYTGFGAGMASYTGTGMLW